MKNIKTINIRFGQVWKAARDYAIIAYSPQEGCVIPKNTRVLVLNTPLTDSIAFNIMPVTTKGLDKRLVPNLRQMELSKEGFGITINIEYFKRYFILDDDQKIVFDNSDAEEFWNRVKTHR